MIEVTSLTKYYGPHRAIEDVSFKVEQGEILGFLGPNAAGKTTTMRVITGFLPPTGGTVRVAGYDVARQSLDARRHTGYLPETVPLYPEMTARSYLHFAAKLKGLRGGRRRNEVDKVIDVCHIGELADRLIGKLSKGYRQRVGLAQALLGDPDVLVLDEPTVGLDPKQIIETRDLIKSLGGERAVILSTHILPEVSMTCNRVIIIDRGRVVAVDTPENLTSRLRGSGRLQVQVRGPASAVAKAMKGVDGVLGVEHGPGDGAGEVFVVTAKEDADIREELASTIIKGGWGLLELKTVGMSLEEIFLKLTTREEASQ